MILRRLRLHPFGCFADREVAFEPGLNVVLGPNEAGKSTLFHAARTVLLRTRMDRRKVGEHVARFIPAGGDTVRLSLDLEIADGLVALRREWGPTTASELTLPGGAAISGSEAVSAALDSILAVRQSTLWYVLFTSQTELATATASLKDRAQDALEDLSDILHRAVLETGGVSPDRFRTLVESTLAGLFSNWDTERGCPRSNRGIDNPWKKEIGEVLAAYYERERTAGALERARQVERDLDGANEKLRRSGSALDAAEGFLKEHGQAFQGARERALLEAGLEAARSKARELERVATEWPVASNDAKRFAASAEDLERRVEALRAERSEAETEAANAGLRQKLERVGSAARKLRDAEARLAEAPRISRGDADQIRAAAGTVERLGAGIEAGRLRVDLAYHGARGTRIEVSRDGRPSETIELPAGQGTTIRADWDVRVRHADLEIAVRSGGEEAEKRHAGREAAASRLQELLLAHGVSGVAEADSFERAADALAREAAAAKQALADELAGETLEALEARGRSAGAARPVRPLASIAAELATSELKLADARGELRKREADIGRWEAEHGSLSGLFDKLVAAKTKKADLESRLSAGPPLPPGYADAASFIEAYEKMREERERLKDQQREARSAKDALEHRAPERSAEELAVELEQAAARLAALLDRGKALMRVRAETARLLASTDRAIYDGMRQELGRLMAAMTAGRYSAVAMEGPLPSGLTSRSGVTMGWERMSAGTRDLLALALRLVMVSRFLGGSRGFAMLDDPLVEMDPERQAAAAAALRAFASERQLIVFTCHPSHAELLGGHRITLGP